MNDTKLRRQFDEWAAPLRATQPPPLASIRRRSRLRAGRLAAAAGSAAAVIALAVALAITSVGGSAGPSAAWGSGPYPAPPSQPYVYVSFSLGPTAQIRNAATGAILATLRPPSPSTTFGVAAASATDRLFVVAENPADGTVTFTAIRILTASDGSAAKVRMTPVPHVVLPNGTQVTDLVVNPAGNRFALESQAPDGKLSLSIYNLLDGSLIGRWPAGAVQLTSPLAFLPNGNLAVVWAVNGPTASQSSHVIGSNTVTSSPPTSSPSTGSSTSSGSPSPNPQFELVNRIVDSAVPFRAGSSLDVDSQPDTALHRRIGTLTADGSMTLSAAQTPSSAAQNMPGLPSPPSGMSSIAEYSSATGALVRWIPIGAASALNAPHYCGVVWSSADGRDLLTQCGTQQQEVVDGKVTAVRLAWIFPTSGVQSVSPFAW